MQKKRKRNGGDLNKPRRPFTPSYIFFYILFSDDTWRLLIGVLFALWLTPAVTATADVSRTGAIVLFIMLTSIGWWLSAFPVRKMTGWLKKRILQKGRELK